MRIDKEVLAPYLTYSRPIKYNEDITLYPVLMKDYIDFQYLVLSITCRKDSTFPDKKIIKMGYLEFLFYAYQHPDIGVEYNVPLCGKYYEFALQLLFMVCKDQEIKYNLLTGDIYINGHLVTGDEFDDLRRIIILQNDVDFDIDEFINRDTEERLKKAQRDKNRGKEAPTIEDYVDSLLVATSYKEEDIMNMSIRKFWRIVRRVNERDEYLVRRQGECSGLVKFKEPIKHWMNPIEEDRGYDSVKTDEQSLINKVKQANS